MQEGCVCRSVLPGPRPHTPPGEGAATGKDPRCRWGENSLDVFPPLKLLSFLEKPASSPGPGLKPAPLIETQEGAQRQPSPPCTPRPAPSAPGGDPHLAALHLQHPHPSRSPEPPGGRLGQLPALDTRLKPPCTLGEHLPTCPGRPYPGAAGNSLPEGSWGCSGGINFKAHSQPPPRRRRPTPPCSS